MDYRPFVSQLRELHHHQVELLLKEAAVLRTAIDAGADVRQLADALGIARSTLYKRMRRTRLSAAVRKAVFDGEVGFDVAELLADLEPAEQKAKLARVLGMTARQAMKWLRSRG